jgi:hypothetical protein
MERGVALREINADQSYIILKNGNKYYYNQLIYSGNTNDWKGKNSVLNKHKIPNYFSWIFDDY